MRSKLVQDNADHLMLSLHQEFYGGELANADAFRVLPLVVDYVKRLEESLHTALCIIENDASAPNTHNGQTLRRWVEELVSESGIDREKFYDDG